MAPAIVPANPPSAAEAGGATQKPGFAKSRLRFMTGMPAGETVRIRDDEGNVLFTYRSFASVIGIVAALIASIVVVAGVAATLFLLLEHNPVTAIAALVLSVFFAMIIVALVPPINVTLFNDSSPALTIAQKSRSSFPSVTFAVVTPEGSPIGTFRKSIFSRLGRNRWRLDGSAYAIEESVSRALIRKIAGKFSRRYEANMLVYAPYEVARIIRRPDAHGDVDVLEITGNGVDRRLLVALATLVFGSEP
ncbi:MAG TPA: hypothetical protein VF381_03955 [Thermoanaerobaculia bacterium]